MAKVITDESNYQNIANSIRNKGVIGTFKPSEMAGAIDSISQGELPTAEENDVIYIDYDGTIRYSYSKSDFLALTEHPANPDHTQDEIPLTSKGWNWSLSDAQAYVSTYDECVIGQMYEPTDHKSHILVQIPTDNFQSDFNYDVTGACDIEVDWGDESAHSTASPSTAVNNQHLYHSYEKSGIYWVSVSITDGVKLRRVITEKLGIILKAYLSGNHNGEYISSGNNGSLSYLKEIILPYNQTSTYILTATYTLYFAKIRGLVIPSGATGGVSVTSSLPNSAVYEYQSFPKGLYDIGSSLYGQYSGNRKTIIQEGTLTIASSNSGFRSIKTLHIPSSITSILANAFYNSSWLRRLYFHGDTPPTVANSNAFSGLDSSAIFFVAYEGLASYLTATNYPSPATRTYIAFAEFNAGEVLPAKDTTQTYNLTWYGTEADAIAQTNPISVALTKHRYYARYSE